MMMFFKLCACVVISVSPNTGLTLQPYGAHLCQSTSQVFGRCACPQFEASTLRCNIYTGCQPDCCSGDNARLETRYKGTVFTSAKTRENNRKRQTSYSCILKQQRMDFTVQSDKCKSKFYKIPDSDCEFHLLPKLSTDCVFHLCIRHEATFALRFCTQDRICPDISIVPKGRKLHISIRVHGYDRRIPKSIVPMVGSTSRMRVQLNPWSGMARVNIYSTIHVPPVVISHIMTRILPLKIQIGRHTDLEQ